MTSLEILAFLDAHTLCVLSTADEKGKPESAVVGFTVHDDFQIIIATSSETRKLANVVVNPQVAVVVWDGSQTLQLEGKAHVLEGKEIAEWQAKHFRNVRIRKNTKTIRTTLCPRRADLAALHRCFAPPMARRRPNTLEMATAQT